MKTFGKLERKLRDCAAYRGDLPGNASCVISRMILIFMNVQIVSPLKMVKLNMFRYLSMIWIISMMKSTTVEEQVCFSILLFIATGICPL